MGLQQQLAYFICFSQCIFEPSDLILQVIIIKYLVLTCCVIIDRFPATTLALCKVFGILSRDPAHHFSHTFLICCVMSIARMALQDYSTCKMSINYYYYYYYKYFFHHKILNPVYI